MKHIILCKLKLFSDHPLLIDYNESFLEIFLNSKPQNIEFFLENIEGIIHNRVQGFRELKDYLNKSNLDFETFLKNINEGSGKFLNAPFSIINEIEKFFIEDNIKFKIFGEKRSFDNQLLMLSVILKKSVRSEEKSNKNNILAKTKDLNKYDSN